ncbi:hypothetical protein B0H19DRAFT_1286145 [Mycena capillaripes]|nr:hypothetical protein B0H19DRAFT_1286145 [Mycena capillaripes]
MGLKVDFKPRLVYIQLESGDAYIDPRLDRAVRDRLMRYGPRFEEKVVIGLSPSQEEIQVRRTEKKGRGEGRLKDLTAVLLCMVLNPYRDPRFLRVSGSEDKARGSIGSWFECPTNVAAARLEHWALGYWWLSCAACERCAGKCEEPPQVLKEWARNAEVAREFEAPIRRAVSTATGEITEGAGQELCDAQELRRSGGGRQSPTQPRFRGSQSQWCNYNWIQREIWQAEISDRVMRDVTSDRMLGMLSASRSGEDNPQLYDSLTLQYCNSDCYPRNRGWVGDWVEGGKKRLLNEQHARDVYIIQTNARTFNLAIILQTLPVADEAYGSEVAIQLKSIRLKDLSQVAARHLGNGGLITVAAWMLAQTHRFTLSTAFFIAASIGNSCIA